MVVAFSAHFDVVVFSFRPLIAVAGFLFLPVVVFFLAAVFSAHFDVVVFSFQPLIAVAGFL